MYNMKQVKLKDITTKIGSGATPLGGKTSYKTTGIAFIRSLNIFDLNFSYDELAYITDEQANKLNNVTIEPDDILLNITGASVARCCILPKNLLPARVNQHVSIIRIKKELVNPYFVQYLLVSPYYKQKLLSIAQGGATREALTKESIENFEITIPNSKKSQDKIANILLNYDKLIENNNKRIKILEEMAQKIYKEWFVDFKSPNYENATFKQTDLGKIPTDWEIVLVESLLKRLKAKNKYTQENVLSQGKIIVIDQSTSDYLGFHNNLPDFIATPKQPLIIFGDHTCKMQMLVEDFSIGPNVIPITSDSVPITFLYYLIDSLIETKEYKRHWNDLIAQKVILPSKQLTLDFSQKITPLMAMINLLKHINQTLKQTRDILLPRLISGEIDVENMEVV